MYVRLYHWRISSQGFNHDYVLKKLVWLLRGKSTEGWWAGAEVGISSHKGFTEGGQRQRGGLNHGGRWYASLRGVEWVQNGYSWLDTIKCNRVSRQFWWLWIYTDARLPLKPRRSMRMAKKPLRWDKVEIFGPNHVTISLHLWKKKHSTKYPLNVNTRAIYVLSGTQLNKKNWKETVSETLFGWSVLCWSWCSRSATMCVF